VKARPAVVLLSCLAATASAWAATIDDLDVTRKSGRYALVAAAHLDATPASIYTVLMDYGDNGYSRISSAYKESSYLEPDADGSPIVHTKMEGCLLWYCMILNRVERLETREPNWIKSYTLPERSNFKYSTSEWSLEDDGAGGTNMTYKTELEPDFWVPPVVGPMVLKHKLSSGGVRAVRRIERLARLLEGLPVDDTVPLPGSVR
jgi:hypothetical protein